MIYPSDMDIILAKRKNPEINKKENIIDIILSYENKEDIDKYYVTVTNFPDVRLSTIPYDRGKTNPFYGIFTITMSTAIKNIKEKKGLFLGTYVNILKDVGYKDYRHIYADTYNDNDYKNDYELLKDFFKNNYNINIDNVKKSNKYESYIAYDYNLDLKINELINLILFIIREYRPSKFNLQKDYRYSYIDSDEFFNLFVINNKNNNNNNDFYKGKQNKFLMKSNSLLTNILVKVLKIYCISYDNYSLTNMKNETIFFARGYKYIGRYSGKEIFYKKDNKDYVLYNNYWEYRMDFLKKQHKGDWS